MGIPQGFILGPFLFLVFINNLAYYVSDNYGIVLFVDDTLI